MLRHPYTLGVLLLGLLLAACDAEPGIEPPEPPPPPAPDQVVRTETLVPASLTLELADLPAPYHTGSARKGAQVVAVPSDPVLRVPTGFGVNVFAEGLDAARWLARTPDGDVLVAASRQGVLWLLQDTTGNGTANLIHRFADGSNGLVQPFGMAFAAGQLYVADPGTVRRFAWQAGQTALTGTGTAVATFPSSGHWTRSLALAPDGQHLYVGIGSASNVTPESAPRATVQRMALDGSGMTTFASGLRNPVGLDFHPTTGDLYTVVNERDALGDDLVPDYFTRIQEGAFFGWPYAYLHPDNLDPRRLSGSQSENPTLAAQTVTPDVLIQSHSAPLGLAFYDGTAFPERYRNGAFVAFHGSWNREHGTGYQVAFVPFDATGRPSGGYEDFLTGFLLDPAGPTTWGRPVGLLILPDGSLLVADDAHGRIYRVFYEG